MKKQNGFMKQFMALVLTASLAAVQAPMPVYAVDISREASDQAAGAGEISLPETGTEQPEASVEAASTEPSQEVRLEEIREPEEEPVAGGAQEPEEVREPEFEDGAGSPDSTIQVNTWDGLQEAFDSASAEKDSPTNITLTGNIAAQEDSNSLTVPKGRYVILDLKGHAIDRKLDTMKDNGNAITVSGNLTLKDSSDKPDTPEYDGTGTITGGYGHIAGGVWVTSKAHFFMKGGSITGNRSKSGDKYHAGGVFVDTKAEFMMEGGSIDNNISEKESVACVGGVLVKGSFTMSGNSSIADNNNIEDFYDVDDIEDLYGIGGVWVYGGDSYGGVSFTMNDGIIKGNHSSFAGGGVRVEYGTLTMNGGVIEENICRNPSEDGGGGVYVLNGNFNLNGGRINGNTASISWGCENFGGGGVFFRSDDKIRTFNMTGGSISGNTVITGDGDNNGGGGVYVYCDGASSDSSTFNMTGGSINGNTVNAENGTCSGGGGVYVNCKLKIFSGNISSNFNMTGGSINGNTVNAENGACSGGGGVYVNCESTKEGAKSTFKMTGGSITGNNISGDNSRGGGVYVYPKYTTFNISGRPVIRDNVKGGELSGEVYTGGTKSNVWLDSAEGYKAEIGVTDTLNDGAEIWADSESEDIVSGQESNGSYFHSDDDRKVFIYDASEAAIKLISLWKALQAQFDAATGTTDNPTLITLDRDYRACSGEPALDIAGGKSVTLDLAGHNIDRGLAVAKDNGNVITVSGSLTLKDSSDDPDTPEYDGNGAITGGYNKTFGGGVCVDGGSFTMKSGSISGNRFYRSDSSQSGGGGVYVRNNGGFMMEGGSISCNKIQGGGSDYGGGGVYVLEGAFKMSGGAINNNIITDINPDLNHGSVGGGGVYIGKGTFKMSGGAISSNSANVYLAQSGGGGVYVHEGSFKMSGGAINGNETNTGSNSSSGGGGVYVDKDGSFTMEGGSISGNNVIGDNSNGGGVFVRDNSAIVVSSAPVIYGNSKGAAPNNVYLSNDAVISIGSELKDGAKIGIYGRTEDLAQVKEGSSYALTPSDAAFFLRDGDDSLIGTLTDGGKVSLKKKTTWAGLQTQFNEASETSGSPTKIWMNQDAVAEGSNSALTVPSGKYVELDLNGFRIDRGLSGNRAKADGNIITVSGNLTLKDSRSTGILTGGNSTGKAGGVQVSGDGVFSMKGGRIALNSAVGIGGVQVSGNGVFSMTGGEITQNTGNAGGGVGFEGGRFELGGDLKISGNVRYGPIIDGKIAGGKTNNVNIYSGKTISINGVMTNTTPVGVTTVPAPKGGEQIIFTENWGYYMQGESPTEFFSSDNEKYSVVMQDGEAALVDHVHNLTYSAEGNTVTAVCSGDKNCGFPDHKATLTIAAPEHEVYRDNKSPEARITDEYGIQGDAKVDYYAADGTKLDSAPLSAGRYRAEITLGEGAGSATAFVEYAIEKAVPVYIIPTGLTAVYGQTLEDVKLPVSDNGVWTWDDEKASVGDAGEKTFKAVFAPNDTDNYRTATEDVTVDVAKAEYTKTSLSANARYGTTGMIALKDNIPEGGACGQVTAGGDTEVLSGNAVITGDVLSYTLKDNREYVGRTVVLTIPVTSCKNYKDYSLTVNLTVKDCSHPATVLKNAKAATCTEKGYSGDLCCRDCNALIKKGEETPIDPNNHDFDYENGVVTREATYLYYGEHTYYCTRDKSHTTTRADIEPLPPKDDRDYSDFAEDTKGLSGNGISQNRTVDPGTGAVTETISIAGEEIAKTVTDPVSGKETVTTKVWIGGLKESYTYTGSAIKPSINVYDGTVKLSEKTDYTVSYSKNKEAGTAEITVRFKGNYSDTKAEKVHFEIKSALLGRDIIAHEIGILAKKKGSVKVSPILTWADTGKKVNSKYFDISPSSVEGEGSFAATITPKSGQNNYAGSAAVTIKAEGDKNKILNNAKVEFKKKSYPYTGNAVVPEYELTLGGRPLVEDTDYKVVGLVNNTDPGTAVMLFEAVSGNSAGLVGSKTASFKISGKKELKEAGSGSPFTYTVEGGENGVPYAKGGARPSVTVRDEDRDITLKEGRDYTLSYTKNKAVTNGVKSAEVKIKGKGNYKGTVILNFAIAKQSLSVLSANIIAKDQFTTKTKLKAPSITITDLDGKKLKAGKDYTLGERIITGDENSGTVTVELTGAAGYSGGAAAVFRYMQTVSSNIGKAKAGKPLPEQSYTGNPVRVSNEELSGVLNLNGNTLVPGTDFKVDGYSGNVKKGKAKVALKGIGGYAGTKTLTFKIVRKKVTYQGALVGDQFK
ncbi:MAG: hypothetical protein K6F35_08035 [Lachnospiraceae bacterium]|nr:hypothetical protein [Lachnospiraceae bacterium]